VRYHAVPVGDPIAVCFADSEHMLNMPINQPLNVIMLNWLIWLIFNVMYTSRLFRGFSGCSVLFV